MIIGGAAIFNHIPSAAASINRSMDSKNPLRAEIAKPKFEQRIDKFESPLRAENAKPKDSISSQMRKIEELCARIDKVEVDLMDAKLSIKELALDFQDRTLDMKRLLLLQENEDIKK